MTVMMTTTTAFELEAGEGSSFGAVVVVFFGFVVPSGSVVVGGSVGFSPGTSNLKFSVLLKRIEN